MSSYFTKDAFRFSGRGHPRSLPQLAATDGIDRYRLRRITSVRQRAHQPPIAGLAQRIERQQQPRLGFGNARAAADVDPERRVEQKMFGG